MQKQFQRLMCAVALAASVNLWAVPQTSALAPAQEEEPALYYDAYGAAFYLTPEQADTLLPDLDAEPVVVELPEEESDLEPLPDDAEDDQPVILPQPDPDQTLDKMDAGFAVTPEQPEKAEEDPPEQTPAVDSYATTDPENISVTVTWGSMNFEYCSGEWDTENLCYKTPDAGEAGWQPVDDNGNTITFTNSGNVAVNVTCSYQNASQTEYDAEVEFKDDTRTQLFTDAFNPVVQLAPEITSADEVALYDYSGSLVKDGTLTVLVTLTGPRPAAEMRNEKIGTITATISAVSSSNTDTTT